MHLTILNEKSILAKDATYYCLGVYSPVSAVKRTIQASQPAGPAESLDIYQLGRLLSNGVL